MAADSWEPIRAQKSGQEDRVFAVFFLTHFCCRISRVYLVGGLEPWNFMTFHSVGNVIIPTDELHHFSEG